VHRRDDRGSRSRGQDEALDPGVAVDDVERPVGRGPKGGLGVGELEILGMDQAMGGRLAIGRPATLRSVAAVCESPVANSVTSWPRATSASVTRWTINSVPP